jgi:hypothetical protein
MLADERDDDCVTPQRASVLPVHKPIGSQALISLTSSMFGPGVVPKSIPDFQEEPFPLELSRNKITSDSRCKISNLLLADKCPLAGL